MDSMLLLMDMLLVIRKMNWFKDFAFWSYVVRTKACFANLLIFISATCIWISAGYSRIMNWLFQHPVITWFGFLQLFPSFIAGTIHMPDFVTSVSSLDLRWSGFSSNIGILLFYVAISKQNLSSDTECGLYVSECT